jgi:hypothetical protein
MKWLQNLFSRGKNTGEPIPQPPKFDPLLAEAERQVRRLFGGRL